MDRRRMMVKQGRLPSGYQEVEYIKTDGKSWINTGVIGATGISGELEIYTISSADGCYLGSRDDSGSSRFYIPTIYSNRYDFAFGGDNLDGNVRLNEKVNIKTIYNGNTYDCYIDDVPVKTKLSGFITHYPLFLFSANRYGSPNSYAPSETRCYVCILIDENHSKLRELIPCFRKSDYVIGMYDICGSICPLTNTPFYINAGTGAFTAGPSV